MDNGGIIADIVVLPQEATAEWHPAQLAFDNVCRAAASPHGPDHDSPDASGKVHGLDGLRVVDASIMPTLVRAPINPTVSMMGERMAALIRQGK